MLTIHCPDLAANPTDGYDGLMAMERDTGRRLTAVCLALALVCGLPARADEPDAEALLAARQPNPWIAGALSLVLPGLGQFYAGERERALVILGGGVALLTGVLVMGQVAGPSPAAGTTPDKPRAPLDAAAFVLNMALPTYWAWNIGDAVRLCQSASESDQATTPQASASPPPSPI
jgi:hypothetical protein